MEISLKNLFVDIAISQVVPPLPPPPLPVCFLIMLFSIWNICFKSCGWSAYKLAGNSYM